MITKTADELYAAASEGGLKTREAPHRDEAQDFLCGLLASGSKPVTEVEAEAKAAGIRPMTLRRAREKLRIVPKKKGYFPGAWHWELPQKGVFRPNPKLHQTPKMSKMITLITCLRGVIFFSKILTLPIALKMMITFEKT